MLLQCRWSSAELTLQHACAGGEIVGADSIKAAFATGKGPIMLRGVAKIQTEGPKMGALPALAAVCGRQLIPASGPEQVVRNVLLQHTADGHSRQHGVAGRRQAPAAGPEGHACPLPRIPPCRRATPHPVSACPCARVCKAGRPAAERGSARCSCSLNKAQARQHMVQGLLLAQGNIDTVVSTIRRAPRTGQQPPSSSRLHSSCRPTRCWPLCTV